jgi:hypothetical protein
MRSPSRLTIIVACALAVIACAAIVAGGIIDRVLVPHPSGGRDDDFEVTLTEPFPAPGENLLLRVTDRSGRLAHIRGVVVYQDFAEGEPLARFTNDAPMRLTRNASTVIGIRPRAQTFRESLHLLVVVDYDRGLKDLDSGAANVAFDVRVYDAGARFWGRVRVIGQAWGIFLIWFLAILALARRRELVAWRPCRAEARWVLVALASAAVLGDALFARPMLMGLEQEARVGPRALTTGLWLGLPLMWLWLQAHRQPAREPWLPTARVRDHTR